MSELDIVKINLTPTKFIGQFPVEYYLGLELALSFLKPFDNIEKEDYESLYEQGVDRIEHLMKRIKFDNPQYFIKK